MQFSIVMAIVGLSLLASCEGDQLARPLRGEYSHIRERPIAVKLYSSPSTCIKAGQMSALECERGFEMAMAKHPAFAQKFADIEVCREVYGSANCTSYALDEGTFASPRPVGFLVCFVEPEGCTNLVFAPIYERDDWGKFTGVDGGFLSHSDGSHYRVSGRVREIPII